MTAVIWNPQTSAPPVADHGYKTGKAPVAFLIRGGPQGSFGDHWHYRWNPQVYAERGYATIFIDFHGSADYGQAFMDAIIGDWAARRTRT